MKKIILILLTTLTLSCCNKDDETKPLTELQKLPPATQRGANTAGCLVNGVAFLPKGFFPSGNLNCNYTDGIDFNIRISQDENDKIRSIYFFNYNQQLEQNQTYILNIDSNNSGFGTYIINAAAAPDPNYYSTNSITTGEFKITYHDFNNAILSGIFWYDAINTQGEIVEIREGRFDMHY
uniref:hypothetical protein n=1 Tax=Flavobacterium sp. TaxID=239 RepID=UPI0040492D63